MNTPKTILAIAVDRYGSKDLLKMRELPMLEVSATEPLVRVRAMGVGVSDSGSGGR